MSDTFGKASRATPAATLEQQILDPNYPKNEREWWAAAEITTLRAENEKLRAAITQAIRQHEEGNRGLSHRTLCEAVYGEQA